MATTKPRPPSGIKRRTTEPPPKRRVTLTEFFKLPVEERLRILKAQAELAREHYVNDPVWREFEGADIDDD